MIGKVIIVCWEECERTSVANAHTQQISIKKYCKISSFFITSFVSKFGSEKSREESFWRGKSS